MAKPTPFIKNKPGVSNWVEDTGGLPPYIREVANALVREHGWTQQRAIQTAVSKMRVWAMGGNNVNKDTQAKAAKALAQWMAMRARAKTKKVVK